MRRTFVLFLTLLLLWTIVAQLNHALSSFAGMRVYLFAGSLYLTFAALTQPVRAGVSSVALGGLVCDANAPAGIFGSHTLLFIVAFFVVHNARDRLPREDTVGRVVVALLANLAIFLVFSFSQVIHSPLPGSVWPRLLADLAASQVFVAVITPWFFALQARALVLAHVDRVGLA
jgi:rod shape-determining protein MreD